MSLRQKSVTSVFWSAAQKWGSRLIGVVVFFLLVRLLSPEAIGLSALAMAFIYFAQAVVAQGFVEAIVQREDLQPDHLDTAFWANAVVGVLISVLAIVLAPWIASLANNPELAPVLRWLTGSFLLSALCGVPTAILQRDFAYKVLAVRYLVGIVLGGVVGVAMAFMGYGVWSLVAQELVYRTASTISLWAQMKWRPKLRFSVQRFRELFAFESSVIWVRSFFALNRRAYDLLISSVFGAATLGFYSLGYRLTNIVEDLISSSTSTVALSSFSRIQNDKERTKRNFYKVTQLTLLFTIPAFTGLAVVAPELVPYAFGEQWTTTVPILQLFALVGIINTTASFNYIIMKAMGKAAWSSWIVLTRAVLTISSFFVVKNSGIVAVTFAYALVELLLSPLSLIAVSKLIGVGFVGYFRRMLGPASGALVMVAVIYTLRHYLMGVSPTLLLASFVVLGALSYVLTLRVVAPKVFSDSFEFVGNVMATVSKPFAAKIARTAVKPVPNASLQGVGLQSSGLQGVGLGNVRLQNVAPQNARVQVVEVPSEPGTEMLGTKTPGAGGLGVEKMKAERGSAERVSAEVKGDAQTDLIASLTRLLEKPGVLAVTLSNRRGDCLAHVGAYPTDAAVLASYSRYLLVTADVLGTRYGAEHTDGVVLEFPQHTLYLARVDTRRILSLHLSDAEALNDVRYLVYKTLPELANSSRDTDSA